MSIPKEVKIAELTKVRDAYELSAWRMEREGEALASMGLGDRAQLIAKEVATQRGIGENLTKQITEIEREGEVV